MPVARPISPKISFCRRKKNKMIKMSKQMNNMMKKEIKMNINSVAPMTPFINKYKNRR